MAETANDIKVSGCLDLRKSTKCYYWYTVLWWYEDKKRERKSETTELPEKSRKNTRNKGRADEILKKRIKEQEFLLCTVAGNKHDESDYKVDILTIPYADFIEKIWFDKAVRRGDRKAVRKALELTTLSGYQQNIQKNIAPYFRTKGILLVELTAEDINEFYDYQFDLGKSGATVIKFHANIVSSLRYAAKKNYIPSADSILKNVIRPASEDFIAKPYLEAEAMKLVEVIKGHPKLELPVILCVYYGLRRSEIVGLRWESIDFDANQITIEHTVKLSKLDGNRIIYAKDNAKSKSSLRTLPLIPLLREKLLEVKAEQEYNRKLCGNSYNREEGIYICVDALGNRIKLDYLSYTFPQFLVKNGLRRIRFHDLRHTAARLLLSAGVPLPAIKEWLGHSTIAITDKLYARYDSSINKVSAQALTWMENTSLALPVAGDATP